MATTFSISEWSGWIQSPTNTQSNSKRITHSNTPDVSNIPAMLRRRLNTLGRATTSQAIQLLPDDDSAAIVYCSRHGDIDRTYSVLQDLASNTPASPMNFSLSVHNAIPGILSINKNIRSCISSIAYGQEGLIPTLLESSALLQESYDMVVGIISDVSLPEIYGYPPQKPFSAGFTMTRDRGIPLSLTYEGPSLDSRVQQDKPEPIIFAEFLESNTEELMSMHNGGRWLIRKQ